MYTPTHEDVAAVRNAAALLTGFARSNLGAQLHQLANRLERGRAQQQQARNTLGVPLHNDNNIV